MNARRRRVAKQRRRFERRIERWLSRWRETGRQIQEAKERAMAQARAGGGLPLDVFRAGMTMGEFLQPFFRRWEREPHAVRAEVRSRELAHRLGLSR